MTAEFLHILYCWYDPFDLGGLEEFVWIQYVLPKDDSASNFYIEDFSYNSSKSL